MPIYRLSNAGNWRKFSNVYRLNNAGNWKKISAIYRLSNAGNWQKIFSGLGNAPVSQSTPQLSQSLNASSLVVLSGTIYHWTNSPTSVEYMFEYTFNNGSTWEEFPTLGWQTVTNPSSGSSTVITQTVAAAYVLANNLNKYRFRVRATNASGTTLETATYIAEIQGPTDITVTPGTTTSTSVPLSWGASTGAGSYIVYYGTSLNPTTAFTTTTNQSATVTGLSASTTYYFRVRPYTGTSGNGYAGNFSANANATTQAISPPGAPTSLSAINVGTNRSYNDGRIDLGWTAPTNPGGSAISGYRIDRSTNGSSFTILVSNTLSTAVSYSNTGLTSGQTYYYKVYAINSGGTGTESNTASTTATTIPQAPTIGTATRVSNTQASIGFTLNNNGGASVSSLIVASAPTVSLTYSGTSSPVAVSGTFTLNQGYTFTVRAVNANGSSFSSGSSNQITINQASAPSAPTSLQRSPGSGFAKTFSWGVPSSNGGSAISGYEYSVDGGSSWLPTSSSSSQSYTYSVTSATFAVRAVNAAGPGTAASMSFTIPTVTTPTASSVTSTSATVSWSSSGQSSYSLSGVGPNSPYSGTTATSVNVTGLSAATNYSPVVIVTSPTSDTVTSSAGSFTTGGGTVAPSNVQVSVTSSGLNGDFIPGSVLTATFTASGTTPFTSTSYQWARSTNNSTWSNVGTNSNQLSTNSTYNNYYVRCTVTVTNSAGSASGTSQSYFMSDAIQY